MQTRAFSVSQKMRVTLSLTSLASLIVIAAVMSGCNPGQTNRSSDQPLTVSSPTASPSPLASPIPSGTPSIESGDTIIVIKDGSADIKIDSKCTDTSDVDCSKAFDSVSIGPTGGPFVDCGTLNPSSKIEIDAGGENKNIRVWESSQKVHMHFDRSIYKKVNCKAGYQYCNPVSDVGVYLVRIDKKTTCRVCETCEVHINQKR